MVWPYIPLTHQEEVFKEKETLFTKPPVEIYVEVEKKKDLDRPYNPDKESIRVGLKFSYKIEEDKEEK